MAFSDKLFSWFDHKVHQSEKINSLQLLNPEISIKWHDNDRLEKLKAPIKILKKMKNRKSARIKGICDSVSWVNPNSADVKRKIAMFEELTKLQRQVFN